MDDGSMILEGGAIRGVFSVGVLDFLQEQSFEIRKVIGVSAGSSNGLNFLSGQKGRMLECTLSQGDGEKLIDIKKVIKNKSLFDMEQIFEKDPYGSHPFDFEHFFGSPMELELVVTNCVTGKAEYLQEKEDAKRLMKLAKASSSLPLLAHMVEIDGIPYLDGGLADSIPLIHSMREGNRKNVLILTRNKGYRKKYSRKSAAVYQAAFKKYPKLVKCICTRPLQYNHTMDLIEKWEEEGKIFVVRPQVPVISRMESDPKAVTDFYHHGYLQMKHQYENMLEFLEK